MGPIGHIGGCCGVYRGSIRASVGSVGLYRGSVGVYRGCSGAYRAYRGLQWGLWGSIGLYGVLQCYMGFYRACRIMRVLRGPIGQPYRAIFGAVPPRAPPPLSGSLIKAINSAPPLPNCRAGLWGGGGGEVLTEHNGPIETPPPPYMPHRPHCTPYRPRQSPYRARQPPLKPL